MDVYAVELERAEPDGFAAIVPALPGLLVLGSDVDEVLRRVRVAIAFHDGCGLFPIRLAILEWARKAELSADRAGLLGSQDVVASQRLFMKMAGKAGLSERTPG